jgi:hypothetical protein
VSIQIHKNFYGHVLEGRLAIWVTNFSDEAVTLPPGFQLSVFEPADENEYEVLSDPFESDPSDIPVYSQTSAPASSEEQIESKTEETPKDPHRYWTDGKVDFSKLPPFLKGLPLELDAMDADTETICDFLDETVMKWPNLFTTDNTPGLVKDF